MSKYNLIRTKDSWVEVCFHMGTTGARAHKITTLDDTIASDGIHPSDCGQQFDWREKHFPVLDDVPCAKVAKSN